MVTTRRGSTTDPDAPLPKAGKKHKGAVPDPVEEEEEEHSEQPDKKKAKSASGESVKRSVTIEEVPDPDVNPQKHMTIPETSSSSSFAREEKVAASPILEKGIVYFFLRGKVDVEHPGSLDEVKRSYMVLRPLPRGDGLVDGIAQDSGNNRLLAIPKKRLPTRGYEKFLTFVEEPGAGLETIRDRYLDGRTYQTKTVGWVYIRSPGGPGLLC